ncbi:hypothetical protein NW754_014104 [Fusarium falciforme]|uniref:4-coumarate-CoA ligase n=1 Tax=Fusarium falciforme TaxID=195108 RepID=A0A9W8RAS7_9HYPO|nr:Hypothetical protein NCS54_01030700 [Fusarium falciforme]KAJ4162685.1 hypothetical protein NW754_014104 [Fusarium falciforme]KAJ4192089.1 hypothetical protein NW755_004225 [Fusarium falciforme]KAJ4254582.1 hypothetical protein NW757_004918 [Fusarium falciforme]WAO92786.1 Hypothetical protein NCS54_01030700 [Fusarium falciforme]
MPYSSPFADVDIPLVDVWNLYMERPREFPDNQPILIDGDTNRSYTFAQIRDLSAAFGRGLRHTFDWQKGDVLAFFAPNHIDTAVVNLGVLWAGGVASPANPTYTAEELASQLVDARAQALVTHKAFLQTACKAAELASLKPERIILLGDGKDDAGRFRHWTEVTDKGAWFKPKKPTIDPQKDLAYLSYSSGTMGLPKGVMLTHYNMVANACQFDKFDLRLLNWELDAQLGVLPFFHIYGLGVVLNVSLLSGAKCVVMAKFDLAQACQLIQDHRLTFVYVPPPIILALGKHPLVSQYDLSSLRFVNSAAAPLSRDLVDAVWDRLGVMVKQGYGLTETSPAVSVQMFDEWRRYLGSVGRLVPNMQAKIVDPEGKELPPNESGELLLKGPNVFQGYWSRPELNKETFTEDGWFKTGDVVYIDTSGNLFITDRIKELIKYKGFQVAPAELEAKLIGRKDIADVCVIGVWNEDEQTEAPRAYVVPSAGVDGSEELAADIIEWLGSRVGPSKRLRGGVRFVKEIPKSPSGKILRRILRDQMNKEEGGPKAKL